LVISKKKIFHHRQTANEKEANTARQRIRPHHSKKGVIEKPIDHPSPAKDPPLKTKKVRSLRKKKSYRGKEEKHDRYKKTHRRLYGGSNESNDWGNLENLKER